jgi:anion-transporting  ArsA/GET3 family ATPase
LSEIVLVNSDQFKDIEEVAELRLKGMTPYAIGRRLGITQRLVKERFDLWKEMVQRDTESRDAAKDHLNIMVVHFDNLIKESYELLDDLKAMDFNEKVAAQINATLTNISNYESKRVDALQKAGLLEGSNMGDELAEMEEKQAILIDILRNDLCPECQRTVARRLQEVTKQVEVVESHVE